VQSTFGAHCVNHTLGLLECISSACLVTGENRLTDGLDGGTELGALCREMLIAGNGLTGAFASLFAISHLGIPKNKSFIGSTLEFKSGVDHSVFGRLDGRFVYNVAQSEKKGGKTPLRFRKSASLYQNGAVATNFYLARAMSLLRSAATVSAFTLLSRVTGLVRDMLIARYFGVNAATDAFYVAFRIPNLLRRLFAEGAFSQAFVPMLSQVKEQEGRARAEVFIGNVFTLLAISVLLASVLGVLFAPAIIWLIATGFVDTPKTFALAVALTRFMFPYIIFMSLVAFAAAVLNTWKHFAIPAFTPVLLNVSFIVFILLLSERLSEPVWALAYAVIVGGALQLGLQLIQVKRLGLFPRLFSPKSALADGAVRQMLRLMVPAIVGVAVAPISILINTNIASRLVAGSVTWLSYADRLMEFPTALLGVALGTVLLPSLSRAYARGDATTYQRLLDTGLRLVLLFALPASVGLGLAAEALSAVLFQGKHFMALDVAQTAVAMRGYAVGMIGLIGIKIVAPAYYARKDIKTPVRVAIASVALVQLLNCVTVPLFAHAGLALSVALGSCFNAGLLLILLIRRGWYVPAAGWIALTVRIAIAAFAMALVLLALQSGLDWASMQSVWEERLLKVAGLVLAAGCVYFIVLFICGWRGEELRRAARES